MSRQLPLVLLHGSRSAAAALQPLQGALTRFGPVRAFDLVGHGGREIPAVFSMETLAQDVLAQMDRAGIERAYLFGHSMGGYLALYLARHAPERIAAVCSLAAKWVFDAPTVSHFTHLSSMTRIGAPGSTQPERMDRLHPGQDWTRLVSGLAELYRELGRKPALTGADLRAISVPALILTGHADQVVPWAESLRLGNLIPHAHGFTFAGKAHPLEIVPTDFLATVISAWIEQLEALGNRSGSLRH